MTTPIHYAESLPAIPTSIRLAAGLPTHGLCGDVIPENAWSSNVADVRCLACLAALADWYFRQWREVQDRYMKLVASK